MYSKYAGTEVEFNGTNHLLLKEDDIVGILETDDVKDLKPLNDRVLIKVYFSYFIYIQKGKMVNKISSQMFKILVG